MKKFKKSTGLTVALLIYVSATAAYFLWLVLRKKEELQRKRREEDRTEQK